MRALIAAATVAAVLLLGASPAGRAQDFPAVQSPPLTQGPALTVRHPVARWRAVAMQITAYCLSGTTATGVRVRPGIVAVDPAQIPLGSRMAVPGYGWADAQDTGSAITRGHLDLWMSSCHAATEWGRRDEIVEVLR